MTVHPNQIAMNAESAVEMITRNSSGVAKESARARSGLGRHS